MEAWISQLFSMVDPTLAPWIVFGLLLLSGVGIPLGEDIIIVPAGILVAHDAIPLWPTLIAAYAGVVCADMMWFIVCTKFGSRILNKKWFKRTIHPKRMLQVKYQFDKRGAWVIVLSRFIPASRTTTITVAGVMHMPFVKFAVPTLLCCLLTVPMQLFAGWWIAESLQAKSTVELFVRLVGLVMVVVALLWAYRLWISHRITGEEIPRAKASWLRRFRK